MVKQKRMIFARVPTQQSMPLLAKSQKEENKELVITSISLKSLIREI